MKYSYSPMFLAVSAAVLSMSQSAFVAAQEVATLEEVIVTGTRAPGRTAEDLPVPVDVLTAEAMTETGETEVGRMLQRLAPSFNFSSSSISDGTDALRPATLRGLGPDQTLVLINGKRRHQAALIHVTKQLAAELAPRVRVNALAPGLVKTDFAKALWEDGKGDLVAKAYPLERLGEVEDVAGAALFLAAETGRWVTGQTWILDGGGMIAFRDTA